MVLVEDKASVREVTAALLASQGHQVASFHSAEAALAAWDPSAPPRLVLTDQRMPGISGLDMLRALRQRGYVGAAVVYSGYPEEIEPQALAELEAEFLAKPFARDELTQALLRAMRRTAA